MTYDHSYDGWKVRASVAVNEAETAADPGAIPRARERARAKLADYPGELLWHEERYAGLHVITAFKYPPDIAARVSARLRARALKGETRMQP